MPTSKHTAYTAAAANLLTTETNSLANNANCTASGAIDNTTNLELYVDLELILAAQGSARSAGAKAILYITPALDGTNYADANESCAEVWATFTLDAATTARRCVVRDVPVPPCLFKVFLRNETGQAFAASGSSIRFRSHNIATN